MEAPNCDYGGEFKSIKAVDEFTVKITLCVPDPAFPSKIAFSSFAIQPKEYLESTGATGDILEKPIGTGPYKVESWERGNQLVLSRFDDYWGDPAKNARPSSSAGAPSSLSACSSCSPAPWMVSTTSARMTSLPWKLTPTFN